MAGYCVTRNLFSFALKSSSRRLVLRNELFLKAHVSTNTVKSKQPSLSLLTVAGVGAGAVLGGGYSFYAMKKDRNPVSNDGIGKTDAIIKNFPDVTISRRVSRSIEISLLSLPNIYWSIPFF